MAQWQPQNSEILSGANCFITRPLDKSNSTYISQHSGDKKMITANTIGQVLLKLENVAIMQIRRIKLILGLENLKRCMTSTSLNQSKRNRSVETC